MSCNCTSEFGPSYIKTVTVDAGVDENGMEQKKIIAIDSTQPIFQKDNVNYNDIGYTLYMEYRDVEPKNLDECINILIDIEKRIQFNVFNLRDDFRHFSNYPYENTTIVISIGEINMRYQINEDYGRNGQFEGFKEIFDKFKELLSSHVSMIDKNNTSIARNKHDCTWHNRLLRDYILNNKDNFDKHIHRFKGINIEGYIAPEPPEPPEPPKDRKIGLPPDRDGVWMKRRGKQVFIKNPSRGIELVEPNLGEVKPSRKFSLGSLDVCDDVYNKTVEWMDSRKDYIYIEYNNVKDNK
jgi:hypothetical protein